MMNIKRILYWLLSGALVSALIPLSLLANQSSIDAKANTSNIAVKGLLMLDASHFDGVYGEGEKVTETQVRKATLELSANLTPTISLELSGKFEDGLDEVELKDARVNWDITKHQQLSFGQQKEPIGLENNQSSKQIAATERSMATALFTPDRHIGLALSSKAPRHHLAIGLFETDDEGLAVSGRATTAILKNKAQTLHLGASISHRDVGGTSIKLKDEGGVNLAENIISSSRYDVDKVNTKAVEAAWLQGSLSLQAEWFETGMQLAENNPNPRYSGGYLQGAWLFGQDDVKRRYNKGSFKLSNLKGKTAWEGVVRVGRADLRDADGGTQADTLMAGINYYSGKHLRIMGSVVTADTLDSDGTDSKGNAAMLRLQYAY